MTGKWARITINLELETTGFGKQAGQPGLTEQNITISKDVQSERLNKALG